MKKKASVVLLIVIIIAAAGVWFFGREKTKPVLLDNSKNVATTTVENNQSSGACSLSSPNCTAATTSANIITYFCQEGILIANYASSSVSLTLKDGKNLVLPQAMSASGIRYEKGITVFISKGDNSYLMEKNIITYTNCVAGSQINAQGISTFTDQEKTFSFSHSSQFILSGGELGYSPNWSYDASTSGLILAVVNIPRSFMPGTNFGEAKFTVSTSADPDAVKNCLVSGFGGTTTVENINGTKFTKMNFTGVGARNIYDTTAYHTILNSQCYAVEYLIHSSNIYNYSPDQGIKQFDENKVRTLLENMAQSFKFLNISSSAASGG
jgi:membrane-bound inhibitor of C-type lysozyme